MDRLTPKSQALLKALMERVRQFSKRTGRRPRILVVQLDALAPDRILQAVAAEFADLGLDVDVAPPIADPVVVAGMAVESDVHGIYLLGTETITAPVEKTLGRILSQTGGGDVRISTHTHHSVHQAVQMFL